jgi:hypothetical protein
VTGRIREIEKTNPMTSSGFKPAAFQLVAQAQQPTILSHLTGDIEN